MPIPDEALEAAAKAVWLACSHPNGATWENAPEYERGHYLFDAQVAISGLTADGYTVVKLPTVEQIERAIHDQECGCERASGRCSFPFRLAARAVLALLRGEGQTDG